MISLDSPIQTIPDAWKVNLQDYAGCEDAIDQLIAQGISLVNYDQPALPSKSCIVALSRRIRELLSDANAGIALLDLGHEVYSSPGLLNRAQLLVLLVGGHFGQTVTRNYQGNAPFFPLYFRKEGNEAGYVGNGQLNNQPGVHTDGSAWRKARIDVLALLSVRRAESGGATIVVNSLRAFEALPHETQRLLCKRFFFRQDPFEPLNANPIRRTIYHNVRTPLYNGLGIRYHRMRIEGGHHFMQKPLRPHDIVLLNELDRFLTDARFRHQFFLESGQILFLNNNFICHDRTRFVDVDRRPRLLYRYWAGAVLKSSRAEGPGARD